MATSTDPGHLELFQTSCLCTEGFGKIKVVQDEFHPKVKEGRFLREHPRCPERAVVVGLGVLG